jgi:UDP-2-acetamido-3-amino-2,3-dideoxy-glucuronate N-acetyltransferase
LNIAETAIVSEGVTFGKNVDIGHFVIIKHGCTFGDNVTVKEFTRIDAGCRIGNNVNIRGHSVICEKMVIEGNNDLGHNLVCTNHFKMAKFTREKDDTFPPRIMWGATIGTNCTLMPGVVIGRYCKVGEGSIVRKSLSDNTVFITPNKLSFLKVTES